ncbi:CDP-alcohol phosphatidyltransferase family protein [Pseudorhodoplanes sinuspersici]|uniref:Phosphatidylcholine synthase n=1 Tax=Pseudorhodoplanes sinuspersici TaxID=1235591 RepID=A0A1W7A0N0_9HYPH|nr:phosphatidylcholine synthase [Pseudorhodoplanes sinuspersici]ARQ03154.1 phosphatidylcholine synthase [Pseudorhodoplanes sinuspersici]RKE73477.1 CDP-diacylglycerol-choline O-phosphatidyltransferase [Pseudorhodoplanes sinuspersici]
MHDANDSANRPIDRVAPMRPFLVHIFTACGAGCALLALLAAARADWVTMFVWLAIALLIDGVDGTLARHFRVAERLPRWSGNALDLVVDFTTYVFVPAFAFATGGLLPSPVAVPLAIAIVVTSALYFADQQMKTADNYFRGFPALWNAAAFHLFILKLPDWVAAAIVATLVCLTFMPLRVLHPFRVTQLRVVNLAVMALWCVLGAYALVAALDPGTIIAWSLAALAVYFLTIGLATADD